MQTFEWHSKRSNVYCLAFYFKMCWIFLVTHREKQASLITAYLSLSVREHFIHIWLNIDNLMVENGKVNFRLSNAQSLDYEWYLNRKRFYGCWLQDTILIDMKILAWPSILMHFMQNEKWLLLRNEVPHSTRRGSERELHDKCV